MPHRKLIARLQSLSSVSVDDRRTLEAMPYKIREFGKGEIVARTGDRPQSCCVILTGFLCRQKIVAVRNQITAIYIAGDMPDLHTLHLPRMDRELCSIGASTVAFVPHVYLRHALEMSAGLTNAFWRETLVQAEIHREWVDNLGSRQAVSRVAHLICEILARLESVGLCEDLIFDAPFTQKIIAEACGLSHVHSNRSIQELRHQGLIAWQGKTMQILLRDDLEALAEFSPAYLQALNSPNRRTRFEHSV